MLDDCGDPQTVKSMASGILPGALAVFIQGKGSGSRGHSPSAYS